VVAATAALRDAPSAELFFLRGSARHALARQSSDADLLKDAGLDFARCLAHFPRSDLAAPALVELGAIHRRLGEPATADRLFEEARDTLDPDDHPRYVQRLRDLTAAR
jgi:tetratricopeptide (TPR) repeat protein